MEKKVSVSGLVFRVVSTMPKFEVVAISSLSVVATSEDS